MVTRDLLGSKHNRVIDLGELAEIAKGRCALLHLPYDSRSVADGVEMALARWRKGRANGTPA
jgi:hypothetical protein